MERLISDTAKMTDIQEKLNITVKEGNMSFANMVNAISVLQTKLNIAGATAQEAAGTIEGSLNATKAAWENLVTDLGNGTADIEQDVEHLTEYLGYAIDNITPVIENVISQFPTALEGIVDAAGDIIPALAQTIIENAPNLLDSAFTMVSTLAQGIADNLPVLVPSAVDAVIKIGETLLDNIDTIIDVAGKLIEGLAKGLIQAIPIVIEKIPEIIEHIATGFYDGVTTLVETAQKMVTAIITVLADYEQWEQVGAGWYNALVRGLNGEYDAEHAAAMAKFEGKTVEELNQLRVNLQRQANGLEQAKNEIVEGIKKNGVLNADDISDLFVRNQFKEWRKTHQSEGWDVFFATELNEFNKQISNINEAMGQAANGVYETAVESGETIDAAGETVVAHANDYGKNAQLAYAAMFEGGYRSMDSSLKHYAEGLDKMLATHKITQDEYDKKLSAYLNNNMDKNSELWWKYYDGIEKRKEQAQAQALKESQKAQKEADKEAKKSADNVKETITVIGSTILNAFSVMSTTIGTSITDKAKTLSSVIGVAWSGLGTNIKKVMETHTKEIEASTKTYTNTLQGIWDGYVGQLDLWKKADIDIGEGLTAWQVGDIDDQTASLQRYEDTYKAVLGRMGDEIDDTEKNLLRKISGMSLEDKTSFTDYLARMTNAEFNAYMQSYKKYVEQAGELAVLEGNSISDINEEVAQSLINDVDYEGIGKTGAQQYLSGFYEGIKDFAVDIGTVSTSTAEIAKAVPVTSTPAQTTPENITVNINGIQFKTVDELSQALIQAITNTTNRRKAGYAV